MQPLFVFVAETNKQTLGLESRFKISFLSPKVAQGRIELVVHTWWTPHHHPVLRTGDPSSCISGTIEVSEPSTWSSRSVIIVIRIIRVIGVCSFWFFHLPSSSNITGCSRKSRSQSDGSWPLVGSCIIKAYDILSSDERRALNLGFGRVCSMSSIFFMMSRMSRMLWRSVFGRTGSFWTLPFLECISPFFECMSPFVEASTAMTRMNGKRLLAILASSSRRMLEGSNSHKARLSLIDYRAVCFNLTPWYSKWETQEKQTISWLLPFSADIGTF